MSIDYDVNSFIGKWVDDYVWCDSEYIKLEQSILNIQKVYPYPTDIPRDMIVFLYQIIDLMMITGWENFAIDKINADDQTDMYDRFERFKVVISCVLSGENINEIEFGYNPY
ncbi:Imm41 family immunity protein [Moraxella cuniculi]|nr:Imm41 family immunity protein [Moraxella cuniculi]